jgi:hypothetical protein
MIEEVLVVLDFYLFKKDGEWGRIYFSEEFGYK